MDSNELCKELLAVAGICPWALGSELLTYDVRFRQPVLPG